MITKIYAIRDNHWIRYVGKTVKVLDKRLAEHLKEARDGGMSHKSCGIRKMFQEGRLPTISLLEVAEGNGSKEEKKWIAYFRHYGIDLWNETDGGEGIIDSTGEVSKRRVATKRAKGIPFQTTASKAKISATLMGHAVPEYVRRKLRVSLKGRLPWNTGKQTCLRGKPISEDHKRKIGLGNKGKVRTIEMRQHYSEVRIGKKLSDVHKRRISEGLKNSVRHCKSKMLSVA